MEYNAEQFKNTEKLSKAASEELVRDLVSEFELACREDKQGKPKSEDEVKDSRLDYMVGVVSDMVAESSALVGPVLDAMASSRKEDVRKWAATFLAEPPVLKVQEIERILDKLLDDDSPHIRSLTLRHALGKGNYRDTVPAGILRAVDKYLWRYHPDALRSNDES